MAETIDLVPQAAKNAEEHARADTQRNKQLFNWADGVLRSLGLDRAIAAAKSIQELRRITLNVDSAELALAIRDALRPASGQRQEHVRGLKEGGKRYSAEGGNRFGLFNSFSTAMRRSLTILHT